MDYEEWMKEYDEREFRRQTEISSLDDYPVCEKNRISVVKGALGEIFPRGDKRSMITGILNQPVYQTRGEHYWMKTCLLYTSPSPRDQRGSRMPSSA